MDSISFKIENAKEIYECLKELPQLTKDNILRSLNREAGSKFLVKRLRDELPYSNKYKQDIKVNNIKEDKTGVVIGPSSKSYKLRWLEFGTKKRITKSGANRGQIIGKEKIGPIIDEQINPIIDWYNEELGERINNHIVKKIKRLRK